MDASQAIMTRAKAKATQVERPKALAKASPARRAQRRRWVGVRAFDIQMRRKPRRQQMRPAMWCGTQRSESIHEVTWAKDHQSMSASVGRRRRALAMAGRMSRPVTASSARAMVRREARGARREFLEPAGLLGSGWVRKWRQKRARMAASPKPAQTTLAMMAWRGVAAARRAAAAVRTYQK
jgi:hypothetical protein